MSTKIVEKAQPVGVPMVLSIAPVVLTATGRGQDLQVRITMPVTGHALPLIIFSHGNGQSHHAYAPLANYWAANGFIVIQPTHLDSRMLGIGPDDTRRSRFWRFREEDVLRVLNGLGEIEDAASMSRGRFDHARVAVAGHSWGGQTASTFLGATHPDPDNGTLVDRKDARVGAGILLAVPGLGGASLSDFATRNYPFMHPNFSTMSTPALIIAGDSDQGGLTTRGPDWWRDAYDLSPAPKALFTVSGGEHSLGGIPGYESRETTDERPQRVDAIQRITTAFLRGVFYPEKLSWRETLAGSARDLSAEGTVEIK